jgi:ATP-dependent DNA helicase RecQ
VDLDTIRDLLKRWPDSDEIECVGVRGCHARLVKLLMQLRSGQSFGAGDLASSFRHVLRHEDCRAPATEPTFLRVPACGNWPDPETWKRYGVVTEPERNGKYLIHAASWSPAWLDKATPYAGSFAGEKRRAQEPDSLFDPCLAESEQRYTHYLCAGQKTAIRAMFNADPGRTTLVLLPTGSGKSLAFLAPALLGNKTGTALVAVPTKALALDQERQVKDMLRSMGQPSGQGIRFAYHGEMADEEREGVRARLRDGEQRILFAHPQSILGSLSPALYDSTISFFVIDEAHLVAEWGHEFCPEYQALSGFRRDLLRKAERKFTTLLLTATLAEEGYNTLNVLFGHDKPHLDVVSELELRPEPSYWAARARTPQEKVDWILDAVRHAPRPLIVYASRREEVEEWEKRLRNELSAERVASCHGGTSQKDHVVKRWIEGEVDIMVANSAFGVGMDKQDVRAVIHACVPETLDRYYQEVGRGGRDGYACASVVIWGDEDEAFARKLNQARLISVKKGFDRWQAMFNHSTDVDQDSRTVDLNRVPPYLPGGDAGNQAWNLRTLTLMARTGLIALDSHSWGRPNQQPDEPEDAYSRRCQESFQEHRHLRRVKLLVDDTLDQRVWDKRVETERQRSIEAASESIDRVFDVLNGRKCMSDVLSEAYTLADIGVYPTPSPGRCSYCRDAKRPTVRVAPNLHCTAHSDRAFADGVIKALDFAPNQATLFVRYTNSRDIESRDFIQDICRPLVGIGIREIVCCRERWARVPGFSTLHRWARPRFTVVSDLPGPQENLCIPWTLILLPGDARRMDQVRLARHSEVDGTPAVVIAPDNILCGADDDRSFFEISRAAIYIDDLRRTLQSC